MRKKILVLIISWGFFLLYQNTGYSQGTRQFPSRYPTWISNVSFMKVGIDNWAAGGAALAEDRLSTSPFTNPAALAVDKFGLYAEFGKTTTSEWIIADIKVNGQYVLPTFAAAVFPFKKLALSLGYMNYYQFQYKIRMAVSTISNPEGTGEYTEAKRNIKLHSFFSALSYAPGDKISLGLTAGLNYFTHDDKISTFTTAGDGFGLSVIAGLLIKPFPQISLGYNLKYLTDIKYDMIFRSTENLNTVIHHDPEIYGNNDMIIGQLSDEHFPFIAEFPFVFETGLKYQPFSTLSFYGKVEMQKWSSSSSYDGEDIINYHLGSKVDALKWLNLSFGYFTQDRLFYFPEAELYDQKFLSTGLRMQINESFAISACILDSHLLKEKKYADKYFQTYVAAGVSYAR